MTLGILLTQEHRLLSVAAMLDVFEAVNTFYTEEGQPPFFDIMFIHAGATPPPLYADYRLCAVQEDRTYDVLLIPSFKTHAVARSAQLNCAFIPWLQEQHRAGAAIASFCTGAFLLGATGLLNNRPATTHINADLAFSRAFPSVILKPDAVVTEKDRIYTSGGATNSFHLMMRLVEIYCGRKAAVRTAKLFSVDMDRNRQTYFGTFTPTESHGDDLVKQVQQNIRQHFREVNTIEEIITSIPSSRRNLVRRFKQATGITPIEYLQKTRVEAAKQLLVHSRQSIMEIMLESGYNDFKSFRLIFKKNVGMTPTAYRKKFNGLPA
ncbi:MAG: helix-turn-helix domain-containing protein [Bacteroidetes bacterium]|nr:helix-turn-helix domain-containing protein [Bacteroidota bacterium]